MLLGQAISQQPRTLVDPEPAVDATPSMLQVPCSIWPPDPLDRLAPRAGAGARVRVED